MPPVDEGEVSDKSNTSHPKYDVSILLLSSESEDNIPLIKFKNKPPSEEDEDDLPLSQLREKEEDDIPLSELRKKGSTVVPNQMTRQFKCRYCDEIKFSQKEINDHHRARHEKLKYPDCSEKFNTPSGLH